MPPSLKPLFAPSQAFKLAFKTALAMVLAYGISLAMDWQNPYWAGLAVALCGLSTTGESLLKGLLRVAGTCLALVVSLTLIALFAQDRWGFMVAMSLFVGFCAFLAADSRRGYFWTVAAFTVPLLSVAGGADGLNDFNVVVLRLQQTLLGVVSFSLVWILIWPASSRSRLEQSFADAIAASGVVFQHHLDVSVGRSEPQDALAARRNTLLLSGRLPDLLDAAVMDSYEVEEARHAWRHSVRLLDALSEALEGWRLCLPDCMHLYLPGLLPGNRAFVAEIQGRLQDIESMLAGRAPKGAGPPRQLRAQQAAMKALSPFDRAAVRLLQDTLEDIDRITRELHRRVAEARGFKPLESKPPARHLPLLPRLLDLERWAMVLRVETVLWLAILTVIYVPALPNAATFLVASISLSTSISIQAPQFRPYALLAPVSLGMLIGGSAHIFIMPNLVGFPALATLIFIGVFLLSYLYARPEQSIVKTTTLLLFIILIHVQNTQSFSFLTVANLAVAFALILAIVSIGVYVPISHRAESTFRRTLRRFFESCAGAMAASRSPRQREQSQFDVDVLPRRLPSLVRSLPPEALVEQERQPMEAYAASVEALAGRLAVFDRARDEAQAQAIVERLSEEGRDWRAALQELFGALAVDPAAADRNQLRQRLDRAMTRLEGRIKETLQDLDPGSLSAGEAERLYRLLGAYRGLSEALVDLVGQAERIDWPRITEARF